MAEVQVLISNPDQIITDQEHLFVEERTFDLEGISGQTLEGEEYFRMNPLQRRTIYNRGLQLRNALEQTESQPILVQDISTEPATRISENVDQDIETELGAAVAFESNSHTPEGWLELPQEDRVELERFFGDKLPRANIYTLTQEELEALDNDPNIRYIAFLLPSRIDDFSHANSFIETTYSDKLPTHLFEAKEISRVLGREITSPAIILKKGCVRPIQLAHGLIHIRQYDEGYASVNLAYDQDPLELEAYLFSMGIFLRSNPKGTLHDFLRITYNLPPEEWPDQRLTAWIKQESPILKMMVGLWERFQEEVERRGIALEAEALIQTIMREAVASIIPQLKGLKRTEELLAFRNQAAEEMLKLIALTMPLQEPQELSFEERLKTIDFSKILAGTTEAITIYHLGAKGVPDIPKKNAESVRAALVGCLKIHRRNLLQVRNGRTLEDLLPQAANVAKALFSPEEIQDLIEQIIEEKIYPFFQNKNLL